jgi:hypothetical protein
LIGGASLFLWLAPFFALKQWASTVAGYSNWK